MSLKLLFVGDPHLGRNPSYLTPGTWRKHVIHMLDAALEHADRQKVDALVILGDVFDHNNPHPQDNADFTDWLFRAKEAGIKVILIPGNHDYGDAEYTALEPYTKMRDVVKVFTKPITTKMNGVPVKFFPWSPPDVKHNIGGIKDKLPYLIIHHEEVKGAKMDNGWIADGITPRTKDFLVGGHLHTYQIVGRAERALFVGTALPHHWNHKVQGFTYLQAKFSKGQLHVRHEQLTYNPPFLLKEMRLSKFLKIKTPEPVRTYYRIIAPVGKTIPNDNRIVSRKFDRSLESPANDNGKTEKIKTTIETLPSPIVWLVDRLPQEKRKRAMKVLSSLKVEDE